MPSSTWTAVEWTAAAAFGNVVLVFVLVGATIYYAKQTKATVDELREARIADTLPLLHWQQPSAPSESTGSYDLAQLVLNLTNYGRGAARIVSFGAADDRGETWTNASVAVPSTLPADDRITIVLNQRRAPNDSPQERAVTITVRYTDAQSLRTYETHPRVTADWSRTDNRIRAFDADERTPQARRIRPQ